MSDSELRDQHHESSAAGYTVVARRYRPQTFDELIGQEHVARALKQAISGGRVGHAYLFTGARGVGKTSAARVLAKALNCVQGPTPTPCNECDVCLSVTSGDDVDVIEIDGASNRQIDDIRQLRQNVAVRPSRVPYKVYIIDEVHMLTKEAFNALLKTLEEPPEHVKFIFATTDPEKVPITILSRCQRFDFAGIDAAAIEARLAQIAAAEGVEIDGEALAVLARRAAGSMRDSQSLLEQLLAAAGQRITAEEVYSLLGIAPGERVKHLIDAITTHDAAAALAQLDEAVAGGADVGQIVDQLVGYLRDVMAVVVGCDASQLRYVLPSQHNAVLTLGNELGLHTVLAMIQILDQTAARMRVSVHARTLVEMAVVRMAHLDDLDDLAQAVAELRSSAPAAARGLKKNAEPTARLARAPLRPVAASPRVPANPSAVAPAQVRPPDGPPATSTASVSSLDQPALDAAWNSVVSGLEGLLSSHADAARDVRLSGDGVAIVRFDPSHIMSKEQCEVPANLTLLQESLARQVGQPISLRFEIDTAAAPATAAVPPPRRAMSRRQQQAEVAERPFVARAMELFAADPSTLRVTVPADGDSKS